jgi:Peptidase family S41
MRIPVSLLLALLGPAVAVPAQSPTATPAASSATKIDARTVALTLADRLESDYVYATLGKTYAEALRAKAKAGDYDALDGVFLAKRLGEDLQRVASDGHLHVKFQGLGGGGGPQIILKRPPEGAGAPPPSDRKPVMMRLAPPPAIEQARWLAPGIAFVRFNLFPGSPESTEAARQFMATHASAKTIIIDLRTHRGGGLDEMDAVFPWFFTRPTRLVSLATRKSVDETVGSPFGDGPSLRRVAADPAYVTREHWATPNSDKRLKQAKLYVLTSGLTASAAEHFALAVKHSGRGTLIGQPTYGANHFGGDQSLGGDYTAFIPVGRAYDPATGKDWEGTGIAPDVEVPADAALVEALVRAGVKRDVAMRLSAEVAPTGPMINPGRGV